MNLPFSLGRLVANLGQGCWLEENLTIRLGSPLRAFRVAGWKRRKNCNKETLARKLPWKIKVAGQKCVLADSLEKQMPINIGYNATTDQFPSHSFAALSKAKASFGSHIHTNRDQFVD